MATSTPASIRTTVDMAFTMAGQNMPAATLNQTLPLVVDVVTNHHANLYTELMQRIGMGDKKPERVNLYAVAYHATHRNEQPQLDVWVHNLAVGQVLPTVPLWLQDGPCVPVALDVVYTRTCQEQRIFVGAKGDNIDKKLSMFAAAKPLSLRRLNHFRRKEIVTEVHK